MVASWRPSLELNQDTRRFPISASPFRHRAIRRMKAHYRKHGMGDVTGITEMRFSTCRTQMGLAEDAAADREYSDAEDRCFRGRSFRPFQLASEPGAEAASLRHCVGDPCHIFHRCRAAFAHPATPRRRLRSGLYDGARPERYDHGYLAVQPVLHLPHACAARNIERISLHGTHANPLDPD